MTLPIIKSPVIYLEMTENPKLAEVSLGGHSIQLIDQPDLKFYINLYREVGRDYIWNYRPGQAEDEIDNIIKSSATQLYVLYDGDKAIGMAECDVTDPKNIEVVHFGLLPDYTHKGIGKQFFNNVLVRLWAQKPDRVFLSTCGMDHPKAPQFYQNAGFKIFKETEADFKDYRQTDFYNLEDAPQIPHFETEGRYPA